MKIIRQWRGKRDKSGEEEKKKIQSKAANGNAGEQQGVSRVQESF